MSATDMAVEMGTVGICCLTQRLGPTAKFSCTMEDKSVLRLPGMLEQANVLTGVLKGPDPLAYIQLHEAPTS